MTGETFAFALVGEEDRGWLVETGSAGAAVDLARTTTRARECARGAVGRLRDGA